ncbi:hypothetical protein [Paraburkholderia unamae]|uniref:Uncharacterized protein n=1 Tax=Paraburkholderia unamae TaxID=219649 RepID=A0ABX5KG01_9BURK|nr:hypothetical protein [Paraburkholderia unamae]PVX72011.1 hypothetical protein C7402_12659 [Paraburkholderia unamae]CAG9267084.1 exported hypothetical protein [Paraburkholderia unamae]
MRGRLVVLMTALIALPCVSFADVIEQNLQFGMRAPSATHTGMDCRNWNSGMQWTQGGLSIDPGRLALTLTANALASHSGQQPAAMRDNPCERGTRLREP